MLSLSYLQLSLLLLMSLFTISEAHEGHLHPTANVAEVFSPEGYAPPDKVGSILNRLGRVHFLILHFPIAMIIITVVAEWLWIWYQNPIFSHAARFMIIVAALTAPITALFGLALAYGQSYQGLALDLFVWHRYFGILTAGLAIIAAVLRERYIREKTTSLISYYTCLFFLFLCVNLAGTFGGTLAFGFDLSW